MTLETALLWLAVIVLGIICLTQLFEISSLKRELYDERKKRAVLADSVKTLAKGL